MGTRQAMGLVLFYASILIGIIIIMIGCCGCAYVPGLTPSDLRACDKVYFLSPDFPEWQRKEIHASNDRWNQVGIEQACLIIGDSEHHSIKRIAYGGPEWKTISDSTGGLNVLGAFFGKDDNIVLIDKLNDWETALVALHEFGHARGLAHIPMSAPAVMNPGLTAETPRNLTQADMNECRRVGACWVNGPVAYADSSDGPDDCAVTGGLADGS